MIIDRTGKVGEDFYVLGHASVPVYLLNGVCPTLFDAGFTGLADLYIQAIKVVLGGRKPAFLFLTHAHWDHIGSAGLFKETWPDMKIVASQKTREILSKPSAVERVVSLNREALGALRDWGVTSLCEEPFVPFAIDETLVPWKPYDVDDGVTVQGFPSPGHTRDFTVYWTPERKILIASEAAGCDDVPEFIVNYDAYIEGIETFIRLGAQILCTGHKLVLTGEHVSKYLEHIREVAESYRLFVEELLEQGKSIEEIANHIKQREWEQKSFPKQPLIAYMMNTKRRILTLKERWEMRKMA